MTPEEKALLFDDHAKYSARVDTELKAAEEALKSKKSVFDFGKAKRCVTTQESIVMVLLENAKRPRPKPWKPEEKNGAPNLPAIWRG
jgi:hypothetical protein